jgi:hypothetical protein
MSSTASSLHIGNQLVPLNDHATTNYHEKQRQSIGGHEQSATSSNNKEDHFNTFTLHDDDYNSDVETEDLEHLESKTRTAWIQMRKYDKKIQYWVKKEREVSQFFNILSISKEKFFFTYFEKRIYSSN